MSPNFCSFDANEKVSILQGNSVILQLYLCAGGQPVTNLAAAISGVFQAMGHRDNAIGVTKNLGAMSIDDPSTGYVKIPLSSTETSLMGGEYDISIEFVWGPGNALEWNFSKTLNIIRDQINFP